MTLKSTTAFLENMKIDTSIGYVSFQHISAKLPDVSCVVNCAFDMLKRTLSKCKPTTIDGLWKVVDEKWKRIFLEILQKDLFYIFFIKIYSQTCIETCSPETRLSYQRF